MTFIHKLKWVLGILVVFLLIVTTNLIDRNNFVRVKDSVQTIYEDRLVAKNLIFKMLKSVQQKELAIVGKDTTFFIQQNSKVNDDIRDYTEIFETTKLTPKEAEVFDSLKANINKLRAVENEHISADYSSSEKLMKYIEKVKENLYDLSEIQLKEGSRQMSISKKAIDTVELFTQLEIYLLILLAIVIQIIVIYKPKDQSGD